MKPTGSHPLSRRQYVEEARDLVNYFDGLVKDKDDKARIVGVSEKSSPGSPKQIYARNERARDWTLLPHRRKEQGRRASDDIREKLNRARSNPVLMAIPHVERAVNIMHSQLNEFAEIHVGHLKSAVRIFSSEAEQALDISRRMVKEEMDQLLKEDESRQLKAAEAGGHAHPSAVTSRKGTPLEKVDLFFDRPNGRPSAFDEIRARALLFNEQIREAQQAPKTRRTPASNAASLGSSVVELNRIAEVAHKYADAERLGNKTALREFARNPRLKEELKLSKMIGEGLAKHGFSAQEQGAGFVGAKLVQTLTRFETLTNAMLLHKPADRAGVHYSAVHEFTKACQELVDWKAKEVATLKQAHSALAELLKDSSLDSSQRDVLGTLAKGYADLLAQFEGHDGANKVFEVAQAGLSSPEAASDLVMQYAASYAKAKVE
jgi:hypothetical protein